MTEILFTVKKIDKISGHAELLCEKNGSHKLLNDKFL